MRLGSSSIQSGPSSPGKRVNEAVIRDALPGMLFGVAILIALATGFWAMDHYLDRVEGPTEKRSALCDVMVDQLLNSKDLVEVTRAGILVDRLNCRMWGRLP